MRFVHFVYAMLFGYFWLPCPKCGRMFGGHQATKGLIYKRGFSLKAGSINIWHNNLGSVYGPAEVTCCLKEDEVI